MSSAVFTVISFSVVIFRRFRRMSIILSTIYSFSAVWTLFLLSDILDLWRIYWNKMIFTIFFLLIYKYILYVKNSYSRYLFGVGSQSSTVPHSTIPGRVKVWRENHIYTFYVHTQNMRIIYMTLSWVHGITVRVRTLSAVPVNDDGRTTTTIALALFNNAVD